MNRTDSRFADLDPARDLTPEQLDPHGARARVMLADVTSTDPHAAPRTAPAAPPALRRRLVPAVGVAAALVVGGVAGPAVLGLDSASAQWVALPTGVPAGDANAAAQPCRDLLTDPVTNLTDPAMGLPTSAQVDALPVVVAEDRGTWRFVVLADARWETTCLLQRSTLDRVLGVLGVDSGVSGGGGITPLSDLPTPSPRQVRTVDLMATSVGGTLRSASTVSAITGRVGADVVGVVVEPVGHPKVTATVTNGWFAAWWPEPATTDPTTPPSPSGTGPSAETIKGPSDGALPPRVAITVTLRDGTTTHFAAGSPQTTP